MDDNTNWKQCKNILCVRLDNMGDVILTSPAFRTLKETFPQAKITLLTSSSGASVAPYIPSIDEVITADMPWVKNTNNESIEQLLKLLKQKKFDGAIIFQTYSQNPLPIALLVYLANIPLRLAYCRENPYELVTDWAIDTEPFFQVHHEVDRSLSLVKHIGAQVSDKHLTLEIPKKDKDQATNILQKHGIDLHKGYIIVHPGVSEKKRQFPTEMLAKAVLQIAKDTHLPIVVTGTKPEAYLANQFQNVISLIGKLSVGQLISVIASAKLLISNNTGPIHIAAALRTPVVALYARTNPQHTPWMVNNTVLYFDVPTNMQSKNVLIQYTTPKAKHKMPTYEDIVTAAYALLGIQYKHKIADEVMKWE